MRIFKKEVDHGEPFINDGFCDRVDWILEDTILHDDTYKYYEKYDKTQEERAHLSELERLLRGFEKSDFAVAVITAFQRQLLPEQHLSGVVGRALGYLTFHLIRRGLQSRACTPKGSPRVKESRRYTDIHRYLQTRGHRV